jgi:probable phosphomutase (TIGR03848 family)
VPGSSSRSLVLLVRHGVADYKPGYLYGQIPGVRLSTAGRDQAKRVAERLSGVGFKSVYSSPLERCMQTAEIIAGLKGVEVRAVPELEEVRYGSWQGRSFKSLQRTKLWRTVQLLPSQARFPGGESIPELQLRAVSAVETIRRRHRAPVVVVSHADVIKAITAHYLGMHLDLIQRLEVGTASVTAISFFDSFPRVLRVGDTGDLSDLQPVRPATGRSGSKRKS